MAVRICQYATSARRMSLYLCAAVYLVSKGAQPIDLYPQFAVLPRHRRSAKREAH